MICASVRFYGLVQGVFFRANTRRKAKELEVKGWVRNCDDGSVEALFEGNDEKVKELIAYCSKNIHGAEVEKVDIRYENKFNTFKDFEIRY